MFFTKKLPESTATEKNDKARKGDEKWTRQALPRARHHQDIEDSPHGEALHLDAVGVTLAISHATAEEISHLNGLRDASPNRC